jgi:signal transduction histidine kinase
MILAFAAGVAAMRWTFSGHLLGFDAYRDAFVAEERGRMEAAAASAGDMTAARVQEALKPLEDTPALAFARILDGGGAVKAWVGPAGLEAAAPARVQECGSTQGREKAVCRAMLEDGFLVQGGPRRWAWRAPMLHLSLPIRSAGARVGALHVAVWERGLRARYAASLLGRARRRLLIAAALLLLAAAIALLVAEGLKRPIRRLAEGARRIGSGDFAHRIVLDRQDELGELAAQFNRMAEQLAEVEAMKERFLHSISHDMRSPLTAIVGYAEVIAKDKDSRLSPTARKGVGVIAEETERLNDFVSDILDLAKLEAGKMELAREKVDLGALAQDVETLFQPAARKEGVSLRLDAPRPDGWLVEGDVKALRRVLVNLLSNALKFTPNGGSVTVALEDRGPEVRLTVRDTGKGIPAKDLGKLFTRFGQVDSVPERRGEGTGLGLALCKEFVEAQGGSVGAESALGRGSAFHLQLPRIKA